MSSHQPNIPHWSIRFSHEDYARHADGCKGQIAQPVRQRFGRSETPSGRARCMSCKRLVGKKAWRLIEKQLSEGLLITDTFPHRDDRQQRLRTFIQVKSKDKREVIEINVPPSLRERFRGLSDERVEELLVEAAESTIAAHAAPVEMFHIVKGPIKMDIPADALTLEAFEDLQECVTALDGDMPLREQMKYVEGFVKSAIERTDFERSQPAPIPDPYPSTVTGRNVTNWPAIPRPKTRRARRKKKVVRKARKIEPYL